MAAASAADWFCSLIVYHNPVSAPSAPNPIKPGRAMATIVALTPRLSCENRAIALNSEPARSRDVICLTVSTSSAARNGQCDHGPLPSASTMRSTNGVPITIISDGRMNAISGMVKRTGRRAARSSKRARRSARISAARIRSDSASGVPKLIDWLSVATMLRRLARPVRAPGFRALARDPARHAFPPPSRRTLQRPHGSSSESTRPTCSIA